jgi:hypothetical protein
MTNNTNITTYRHKLTNDNKQDTNETDNKYSKNKAINQQNKNNMVGKSV